MCCFLKGQRGQREFGLSSDSDAVAHFEVIEFSDGVHLANAVKANAVDLTDGVERLAGLKDVVFHLEFLVRLARFLSEEDDVARFQRRFCIDVIVGSEFLFSDFHSFREGSVGVTGLCDKIELSVAFSDGMVSGSAREFLLFFQFVPFVSREALHSVKAREVVAFDDVDERGGVGGTCGIAGAFQSVRPAFVVRGFQLEERGIASSVS